MTRRDFIILLLVGLAVPVFIAQFQSLPGYMDADYYFGGGIQLIKGRGFTEPYLWNYLANPQGLPAPSHAYWMPLASILAAVGMKLTGQTTFAAARLGFILLTSLVPLFTALLAFRLTSNRAPSFLSGLLACFPIYYAPFLPVTDNYAIYMLLGISFFFLLSFLKISRHPALIFIGFGLISALMTLARSDGLLWLGISFLVATWWSRKRIDSTSKFHLLSFIFHLFSILLGFILFMSPWYLRNLQTFGSIMAPGGIRALWLTNYADTFVYPASQLTMQYWLASGWGAILQARLVALGMNLLNAFAAQGGIFLFPFILVGLWKLRSDMCIRFATLAWILLLVAMTIVFPFAGERGAFYHAGAALQPIWWVLAPVGLEAVIVSVRQRGWFDNRAFVIFRSSLVGIAVLMTALIFTLRVLPGWEREDGIYNGMDTLLTEAGAPPNAVVIVRNPPGFYIVTGHSAIALPFNGQDALLAVSEKFHADYLVVEPAGSISEVVNTINLSSLNYLGESNGNRLYEISR